MDKQKEENNMKYLLAALVAVGLIGGSQIATAEHYDICGYKCAHYKQQKVAPDLYDISGEECSSFKLVTLTRDGLRTTNKKVNKP